MSHTQHLADLCALLVREAYGELTSRIFALLLRRGRQTINTIKQHTGLTGRQVRHGLVVLIQQNLLFHNTEQESGATFYEANEDSAYFLLRSGRILETVEERYGVDARDVVQNLLLLGHTKVADLAEAYESKNKTVNGHTNGANGANGATVDGNGMNGTSNGTNGHHDDKKSAINLDGILARLLDDGFVEPVVESMFRSPKDAYNQAEKEAISSSDSGASKSAKATLELKRIVTGTLQKQYEERSWRHGNMKRYMPGGHPKGADKRRKLASGKPAVLGSGSYDEEIKLDRELVVRINYERFTVALRTQALTDVAKNDIGDVTSQVYGELLRLLEDKVPRCRGNSGDEDDEENDTGSSTITTSTLAQALSGDINIGSGIGQAAGNKISSATDGANGTRKRRSESSDEEDVVTSKSRATKVKFDVQASAKQSPENHQARITQLKDHLLLLTGHNHDLLKKLSNDGLGEFTVPFKKATEYMRENELDTYLASAFGKEGLRISHILRKHGKLDEKQVQKIALMRQGEVRKTLVRMQMAGFADIQEVPRDTLRTPSRTIFLWWFDTERITNLVVDRIYKTIARCLQVLETERYKERVVLALADRSDVKGNEHEMLPEDHLVKLSAFNEKEDRLTTQINRLDQLVGIFKEF
ncbi:hypothetical protein V492_05529 [Pseudogymnoascus sp. VKM F-4246]|nr:hypothetical protein V492_05529 [Pseudogymnoascus sp. VKM F-4246]